MILASSDTEFFQFASTPGGAAVCIAAIALAGFVVWVMFK